MLYRLRFSVDLKFNYFSSIFNFYAKMASSTVATDNKRDGTNRYHERQMKDKLVPSHISVVILGSGAGNQMKKSVLITTDKTRYLINCEESFVRLAADSSLLAAANIEHIFVTNKSYTNVAGLLGTCLTLNSFDRLKVCLHGPPVMKDMMDMMTIFSDSKTCSIEFSNLLNQYIEDHAFTISSLTLYKKNSAEINDSCFGYIFEPKDRVPNIDLQKLIDMDIPKALLFNSPLIGKLKNRECVTLPDGRVIDPDLVLLPTKPCGSICVLECASYEYLESLHNSTVLCNLLEQRGSHALSILVHLGPPDVLCDRNYIDWFLARCDPSTRHVLLDGKDEEPHTEAVYRNQAVLNQMDERVFPLLYDQKRFNYPFEPAVKDRQLLTSLDVDCVTGPPALRLAKGKCETSSHNNLKDKRVVSAEQLLSYTLRPTVGGLQSITGFHRELQARLSVDAARWASRYWPSVAFGLLDKKLEETKSLLDEGRQNGRLPIRVCDEVVSKSFSQCDPLYPQLVFLGTASSCPGKHRNVSGIMLETGPQSMIILDSGEGTLHQLITLRGVSETHSSLRNLKVVLISHMHADHHLGLFSLLEERAVAFKKSESLSERPALLLIVPKGFRRWFEFYSQVVLSDYSVLDNVQVVYLPLTDEVLLGKDFEALSAAGLLSVLPILVPHTSNSFGFRLTLTQPSGWSMVYSGDTLPSESLVQAGAKCNLLVHEATFGDENTKEAEVKRHSTVGQALTVAQSMKADALVLTHFSQRYSLLPPQCPSMAELSAISGTTTHGESHSLHLGFAQDFMTIRLADLPYLSYYLQPLTLLFPKHRQISMKKRENLTTITQENVAADVEDAEVAAVADSVDTNKKRKKKSKC